MNRRILSLKYCIGQHRTNFLVLIKKQQHVQSTVASPAYDKMHAWKAYYLLCHVELLWPAFIYSFYTVIIHAFYQHNLYKHHEPQIREKVQHHLSTWRQSSSRSLQRFFLVGWAQSCHPKQDCRFSTMYRLLKKYQTPYLCLKFGWGWSLTS